MTTQNHVKHDTVTGLEKIQALITSVREKLGSLKADSGSMGDLDAVAQERAILREKLGLLEDAETVEHERIAEEEAAAKSEQRRALLLEIARKADISAQEYDTLTERATAVVAELVGVLTEREQVFNRKSIGLDTCEAYELLTQGERRHLIDVFDSSTITVYPGQFSNTWSRAVSDKSKHDSKLARRLIGLVTPKNNPKQDSPLSSAKTSLADFARNLAGSAPVDAVSPEPAQHTETSTSTAAPKKTSPTHYEVDLRSLGRATDLYAD